MVINAKDVAKDGQILNVITVVHQINDIKDYHDKKISAVLIEDGRAMKVTVPTVPHWMWNNVENIYELEQFFCQQTSNAHVAAGLAMKNDKDNKQTKDMIFHFPDGKSCKTDFYDNRNDQFKLKNYFRLLPISTNVGSDQIVKQQIPFVCWKFVIDEEKRLLEAAHDEDEDIGQAIERMTGMNFTRSA
jgi:hypothetical protein